MLGLKLRKTPAQAFNALINRLFCQIIGFIYLSKKIGFIFHQKKKKNHRIYLTQSKNPPPPPPPKKKKNKKVNSRQLHYAISLI
jgi:hypothetical protein